MKDKPPRPIGPHPVAGWREWVGLPALGVEAMKAKLDTGARTSAVHAYDVEQFRARGRDRVRFVLHPMQRDAKSEVAAEAWVLDRREVRSSSGHSTTRWVIETTLQLGSASWPIELTLASRDQMGFRLLLGRQALRGRVLVDPGRSYVLSRPIARAMRRKRTRK